MRERAIGIFPIIEVAPRIDVLTQVFLCEDFFVGGDLWILNDGVACFERKSIVQMM